MLIGLVEAFHEPQGRASSPLRADGCNHDFLRREERRALSDAPYLIPPVHGTDARPILEVEALHELPACEKRFGVRRQAKRDAAFELPTLLAPH